MSPSGRPRRFPMLQRVAVLVFIALTLGGLVVEQSRLLHVHKAESAGLYNEQHVLAALLAAPSGGAPVPGATALAFLVALVGVVALLRGPHLGAPVRRHAAPRAPPVR